MNNQILKNKTAVIFGAGGSLGKQTAKTFIEHGAKVYLSDINEEKLTDIPGAYKTDSINALNENQVEDYLTSITSDGSTLDIVFNASGSNPEQYNHGKPAKEVSLEQFLIPLRTTTASQFVTAKAAYNKMQPHNRGVILFITSTLSKVGSPWSPALTASHAATEGLLKSLASEWGPNGIRVIGVMSEAMPESPAIHYTFTEMGKNIGLDRAQMQEFIEQHKTALKRLPTSLETANLLAFAASEMASYMTGTILNNSGGHFLE